MLNWKVPAAVLGVLCALVPVSAQDFRFDAAVTSGWFSVEPPTGTPYIGSYQHTGEFEVFGDGFHFVGTRTDWGHVGPATACDPPGCVSGQTISLSSQFAGTFMGSGEAMVGGALLSPAYYSGSFTMRAANVALPQGNRKDVILSAPFTMIPGPVYAYRSTSGRLQGPVTELFAMGMLRGQGTATVFLERERELDSRRWLYRVRRVVYAFTPVPPSAGGSGE